MSSHPFIEKHGWSVAEILPQDGSARSYMRIEKNGNQALFMDCGPTEGISYITRLSDFVRIGNWIASLGLCAPQIYEGDEKTNVAIIEDFGNISMKQAIIDGEDPKRLYAAANEILSVLQAAQCPLELPHYKTSFMRTARQRFVDWYVPVYRRAMNEDGLVNNYHSMWDEVEAQLDPYKESFMHVDFHVENLMYLDGGQGVNALGIIDFQEAMIGPESYDLSNLCEDMRADVPQDIQDALKANKDDNFLCWQRVLGTQFHTRLLGQCLRWAMHDNKPGYLKYYPRLLNYTKNALDDPILKPFKDWLADEKIELVDVSELDWQNARTYIAKNAI